MTTINDPLEALRSMLAIYLDHTDGDLQASIKKVMNHIEKQEQPGLESLFGRWATHPDHGRGIITSDHPDGGKVSIHSRWKDSLDGATYFFANVSDLAIDPLTLTTVEDYQGAPEGTVIESEAGYAWKKGGLRWRGYPGAASAREMVNGVGTSRVIRWGNGQ